MLNKDPLEKYHKKIRDNAITKEDITILLDKFNRTKRKDYKKDIGVCLSLIRGDLRIPRKLLSPEVIKEYVNYNPTVLLTYGHLYHNYPAIRPQYLKMMYEGNLNQRMLLSIALAFIMRQDQNIRNEVIKFFNHEKDDSIKQRLKFHLNIEKRLKVLRDIINKYDPVSLFKKQQKHNVYEEQYINIIGYEYKNIPELIERIKKLFSFRFKDSEFVVKDYAEKIAKGWNDYLKTERIN